MSLSAGVGDTGSSPGKVIKPFAQVIPVHCPSE